ncbi:hypothetical protein DEJ47_04835 [Streptomyces venezuelae]|uniref:Uncharacterized protein n=1 Tax=Streptomyces venezuelae TaxID=54571 RepID=A0A5P2B7J7_STRVZ|nr:hypothetical protein DEJ47_04835 [Streptomyces venezuelae]
MSFQCARSSAAASAIVGPSPVLRLSSYRVDGVVQDGGQFINGGAAHLRVCVFELAEGVLVAGGQVGVGGDVEVAGPGQEAAAVGGGRAIGHGCSLRSRRIRWMATAVATKIAINQAQASQMRAVRAVFMRFPWRGWG